MGDPVRCAAKSRRTGKPCGAWPIKGGTVCRLHGGSSPQARARAAARVAEQQAQAAVRKLEITPTADPLTALGLVAGELIALKDHLRTEFEKLQALRYSGAGAEQIRGELQAYQSVLRDTVNALGVLAKMNIDERLA